MECHLRTYPHEPFREKERSIPYKMRKAVQENIRKLIADGILEMHGSEYNSALVIIPKKNGEVRVCLDARRLNKILIPRYEAPVKIEEVIKNFKEKAWLTSTDVTCGYFNVRLPRESRKYTAFSINGIQYRYKVLPFGLKISGQVFINCLERFLRNKVKENLAVYVDDIVIGSPTFEKHLRHLKEFFEDIRTSGITLNLSKTKWAKREIEFVGHRISAEGVMPMEDKLEKIFKIERPRNVKQLRSFIGVVTYYRKFVWNFSELLVPLNELLEKKQEMGVEYKSSAIV